MGLPTNSSGNGWFVPVFVSDVTAGKVVQLLFLMFVVPWDRV